MITTKTPIEISYDGETDILTVEGIQYSGDMFRFFGGLETTPEGRVYRAIRRSDGVIVIQSLQDPEFVKLFEKAFEKRFDYSDI